jgi:hypothetical protein
MARRGHRGRALSPAALLLWRAVPRNLALANLRVLLDFKNISRLSTAGVTLGEKISTWLKPWGSTLARCRLQQEVQGILKTLRFAHAVPIFRDKKAALAADWRNSRAFAGLYSSTRSGLGRVLVVPPLTGCARRC